MSDDTNSNGPYKRDGETIYATEPESESKSNTIESDKPRYKNAGWLHHQYHVLNKSQQQMAEMCGVAQVTIQRHMKRCGIETRERREAISIAKNPYKSYRSEEWLREQYIDLKKPAYKIAEEQNVDDSVIYSWLRHFGVELRSLGEWHDIYNAEKDYTDRDWLHNQYVKLGKSTRQIADECGVHNSTILEWLNRNDIDTRSAKEGLLLHHEKRLLGEQSVKSKQDQKDIAVSNGRLELDHTYGHISERSVETELNHRNEEWLREQYHDENKSTYQIADECGVGEATILRWMEKNDIGRRGGKCNELTEPQVVEIRERYQSESISMDDLSNDYPVSLSAISFIVNGKTYSDAPGPIKGEDY